LRLSRSMTILLGVISIFVSTRFYGMLEFWMYFSNFWTTMVSAPMVLYMFNLRTGIKSYVSGVFVGLSTVAIYRSCTPSDLHAISQLVGMSATIATMLLLHYIKKPEYKQI
jgi:hypothetical protein